MSRTNGLELRHGRSCPAAWDSEARCRCSPSVRAWIWDAEGGRKVRKTFSGPGALAAAKNWRADRTVARSKGEPLGPSRVTLREAGDKFLAKAKAGEILHRGRAPYKPSCLRTYEADLLRYVYPELASRRLSDIRRRDLQALVERLGAQGFPGRGCAASSTLSA